MASARDLRNFYAAPLYQRGDNASEGSVMWVQLRAFIKDETAATAIEYGLIAAGISVAIITVVNGLGSKLKTSFTSISTQLK
jgi:pilus assembly protein Flp/PilA